MTVAPAATVRVLVRNLESDSRLLQFSNFSIESLRDFRRWEAAKEFFPNPDRGEWVLKRDYAVIPPVKENWSGYGAIPYDVEDMLLLLRLYKPGDLAFVRQHLCTPRDSGVQHPYRFISKLVGNFSTRPFKFNQSECSLWEKFGAPLRTSLQWKSVWFSVSRRFFLYGGGKEFNPLQGEVDRVIDFMTTLEAAMVPEVDFVSRRLRERSLRLLGLPDEEVRTVKKLLADMYSIRSTLVHGSPLDNKQTALLQDRDHWWQFQQLVRDVLINALKTVPGEEAERRLYFVQIYDLSDRERAEKVYQDFKAIKDEGVKQDILRKLK